MKKTSKSLKTKLEKMRINRKISRELDIEHNVKYNSNVFDDRTKFKRSRQKRLDKSELTSF